MALTINDNEVERLIEEITRLTGETKTAAVRQALVELGARLANRDTATNREMRIRRFLENEVWPRIPADQIGKTMSQTQQDAILGYGTEGV